MGREFTITTVPALRDDDTIRKALEQWLTDHLRGAARVAVSDLNRPQTAGGSNETLLAQADWTQDDRACGAELVLRIAPTTLQVFLDPQFEHQYRTIEALGRYTNVPVPSVWGFESNQSVLGAPFWIMDRTHGVAPADFPPYNQTGFLVDATPSQREQLWLNAVETLGAIHRVPSEPFEFLHESDSTDTPLRRLVAYWKDSLDWACEGRPSATLEALHQWLLAHWPDEEAPALSWGDARMGNMLFRDWQCVAVLDWEMVSLAGPLVDVGWWLLLDEALSSDIGIERLPGLGGRDETIAVWEQSSGRRARDLEWYEAFAGFRLGVILLRGANIRRVFNVPVPKPGEFGSFEGLVSRLGRRFELPRNVSA
jgi:aminoglycoside phosphotransferase (APT) family kinase protein